MKIRQASSSDVPLILDFINKLAEFEKLSHEVVATEDKIFESLFKSKKAEVVIAELDDQTPVGFALYFETYSTFLAQPGLYLEDLFILSEHRGRGYGTRLLKHLAQLAQSRNLGRFEWSVLNWNQKAIDVYEKIGAQSQSGWTVYRLSGESLLDFSKS